MVEGLVSTILTKWPMKNETFENLMVVWSGGGKGHLYPVSLFDIRTIPLDRCFYCRLEVFLGPFSIPLAFFHSDTFNPVITTATYPYVPTTPSKDYAVLLEHGRSPTCYISHRPPSRR